MKNDKTSKIQSLYFEKHLKQCEIAKQLNVSKQYVSKIVKENEAYPFEKQRRQIENKIKNTEQTKHIMREKREREKMQTAFLKLQHKQATEELSAHKRLLNIDYKKFNSSAYRYNKKNNTYELLEELNCSYDVPTKIRMKATLPTQKYSYRF